MKELSEGTCQSLIGMVRIHELNILDANIEIVSIPYRYGTNTKLDSFAFDIHMDACKSLIGMVRIL